MRSFPPKSRQFALTIALFNGLVFGASCGKIGPPLPPLDAPPPSLGSVTLTRINNRLEFQFEIVQGAPEIATIQQRCRQSGLVLEVLAEIPSKEWTPFQDGSQSLRTPSRQPIDSCAYTLTMIGRRHRASNPSRILRDPGLQAARAPNGLEADVREDQIYLSWKAPLENVDGSRPPNLIGYLINSEHFTADNFYEERDFEFSEEKSYRVQAVSFRSDDLSVLSDFSSDIRVVPLDRFPPQPPSNVSLVRLANRVQVVWDTNQEADLGGYRVYREPAAVSGNQISDLLTVNSYTDAEVLEGRSYTYWVTAVDQAGNESPPSRTTEIRIP